MTEKKKGLKHFGPSPEAKAKKKELDREARLIELIRVNMKNLEDKFKVVHPYCAIEVKQLLPMLQELDELWAKREEEKSND